jgi:hypothetical protein
MFRIFGDSFKNIVFVKVGLFDAGNFKVVEEIYQKKKKKFILMLPNTSI